MSQQIAGLEKWRSVGQAVKTCDIKKFSSSCEVLFHPVKLNLRYRHYGCEQIRNQKCAGSSQSVSLVTARGLSTSQQCWASRFYNPKISITMKKNIERGTSKLIAAEERAKAKREKRLGAKPSVKNPLIDDTRKTKTFNWKFQENIGNVMADFPELLGYGIAITRVSARADFSEVLVFWISSPDKVEVVADLLEAHVRQIRRGMIEGAGMGQIPRVTFVKDIAYMLENELDGLFSRMDTGPKDDQTAEQGEEKLWEQLEELELGTDGLGLKRAELMEGVEMQLEKREAKHRYAGGTSEEFCRVYRNTLARDGGKEKERVEQNIKTFLRQRKKHQRVMNDVADV